MKEKSFQNIGFIAFGIAIFFLINLGTAFAIISNGAPAIDAIGHLAPSGEPDYFDGSPNGGVNAIGLNYPADVEMDPVRHKLFVLDQSNYRVLVFDLNAANELIDHQADYVIGQPNFKRNSSYGYSPGGPVWEYGFSRVDGLAIDPDEGMLFVSDANFSRVLIFDLDNLATGMGAEAVIGQTNFSGQTAGVTQNKLWRPAGMHYDRQGDRLFVADKGNNRVLIFEAPFSNGMDAANVLGQGNFTSGSAGTTSWSMNGPYDIVSDENSRLFVSDEKNNRVLVFQVAGGSLDGIAAQHVLGQADFVTATQHSGTAKGFYWPRGISYDNANNILFVSDARNERVLVFDNAENATITDNMNATFVVGQTNFSGSNGTLAGRNKFHGLSGLQFNSSTGKVYAADSANHRVMIFGAVSANGQNALDNLGQINPDDTPNFSLWKPNNVPSKSGFNLPTDVVVDDVNHRLFVADAGNSRVLAFDLDTNNELLDREADYVIGQPDFKSNTDRSPARNSLDRPIGLAFDRVNERLFVADTYNHRVLIFNVAPGSIANGMNAANVLGFTTFTTNFSSGPPKRNQFNAPSSVAFDPIGQRLFVSERNHRRVLTFNVAPGVINNGMNAAYVIGQADFDDLVFGTTAHNFQYVNGLAYDEADERLFVSDMSNARIMIFNVSAENIANGMDADFVLGQNNFTDDELGNVGDANRINSPEGLDYDFVRKRLFAGDMHIGRVLVFDLAPGSVTNGMAAVNVIGHPDFAFYSTPTPVTDTSLNGPRGVAYDRYSRHLFVTDSRSNRIMIFDAGLDTPNSAPALTVNPIIQRTDGSGIVDISVSVLDSDGDALSLNVRHGLATAGACDEDAVTPDDATLNTGNPAALSDGDTITLEWDAGADTALEDSGYCLYFDLDDGQGRHDVEEVQMAIDTISVPDSLATILGGRVAGANTLTVRGNFIETHPGTNQYQIEINDVLTAAFSGPSGTADPGNVIVDLGLTLDGDDWVRGPIITHTDAFGNVAINDGNAPLADPVYVQPYDPDGSVTDIVPATSFRVTLEPDPAEASTVLYGILVTTSGAFDGTEMYVQADGTLDNTRYLATYADWGGAAGFGALEDLTGQAVGLIAYNPNDAAGNARTDIILIYNDSPIPPLPNDMPVVTSLSAAQLTDGSGEVRVIATVNDPNQDDIELSVLYAQRPAGAACFTVAVYSKATLNEDPDAVTATVEPEPSVENDDAYQIGALNPILTSADNTIAFRWVSSSDVVSDGSEYCIQLVAFDGALFSTSAYIQATVDTQAPRVAAGVAISPAPRAGDGAVTMTVAFTEGSPSRNLYTLRIEDTDGLVADLADLGETGTAAPLPFAFDMAGELLDGDDMITSWSASHQDVFSNITASIGVGRIYVIPYEPTGSVSNADSDSFVVTITPHVDETDEVLYAVAVTADEFDGTEQYVQADGSLGNSPFWNDFDGWGGASGFTVTANAMDDAIAIIARNPNDPSETTLSEFAVLQNPTGDDPTDPTDDDDTPPPPPPPPGGGGGGGGCCSSVPPRPPVPDDDDTDTTDDDVVVEAEIDLTEFGFEILGDGSLRINIATVDDVILPYLDIDKISFWALKGVKDMFRADIMTGSPTAGEGLMFYPQNQINYAEVAKILARVHGYNIEQEKTNKFWYAPWIAYMKKQGWWDVLYTGGEINLWDPVPRGPAVALLLESAGVELDEAEVDAMIASGEIQSFPDVSPDDWYYHEIHYARHILLVTGYKHDGEFKAEKPLTREEYALLAYRVRQFVYNGLIAPEEGLAL